MNELTESERLSLIMSIPSTIKYPKQRKLFEIGIAPGRPSLSFSLSSQGLDFRIIKLNVGILVIRIKGATK